MCDDMAARGDSAGLRVLGTRWFRRHADEVYRGHLGNDMLWCVSRAFHTRSQAVFARVRGDIAFALRMESASEQHIRDIRGTARTIDRERQIRL